MIIRFPLLLCIFLVLSACASPNVKLMAVWDDSNGNNQSLVVTSDKNQNKEINIRPGRKYRLVGIGSYKQGVKKVKLELKGAKVDSGKLEKLASKSTQSLSTDTVMLKAIQAGETIEAQAKATFDSGNGSITSSSTPMLKISAWDNVAATLQSSVKDIYAGESSKITWTTTNAKSVTLNGNNVNLNGSQVVSPSQTTQYNLLVKNPFNQLIKSLTINVKKPRQANCTIEKKDVYEVYLKSSTGQTRLPGYVHQRSKPGYSLQARDVYYSKDLTWALVVAKREKWDNTGFPLKLGYYSLFRLDFYDLHQCRLSKSIDSYANPNGYTTTSIGKVYSSSLNNLLIHFIRTNTVPSGHRAEQVNGVHIYSHSKAINGQLQYLKSVFYPQNYLIQSISNQTFFANMGQAKDKYIALLLKGLINNQITYYFSIIDTLKLAATSPNNIHLVTVNSATVSGDSLTVSGRDARGNTQSRNINIKN
ncbi:hypothetical protein [Aliikangiella sp. G2MR2-5]|uniref:hypothetical protein n=1 Tax=Aliikangiella sp. G2MR2-5 TaxID=2788943 RepID=UPI0018AB27FD|nr:hypothetical protein [Aliikangiella sp. G2MR2-5]